MDPYLAAVLLFGGNFAPRGFALCNGQLLPISQNAALFSLLGTFYGGNGTSTFGLPDLRGRVAVQQGTGPGLTPYDLGEQTGTENVTLLSTNIPQHNHLINASSTTGNTSSPAGAILAEGPKSGSGPAAKAPLYYNNSTPPNVTMNPTSIGFNTGGAGLPVPIVQPVLAVTHIIALQGVFPTRN